jgi:hypothetical protein
MRLEGRSPAAVGAGRSGNAMRRIPRVWRTVLWFGGAALLAAAAGCSLRDDPHYNRFSPHGGRRTVMQHAERAMQAAETGLDNAQRRVENIID